MEEFNPVSLPKHYQLSGGKEVLDYLADITNVMPTELSYFLGNTLKYIGRAPRKNNMVEDLSKAMYYLRDFQVRYHSVNEDTFSGVLVDIKSYKKHLKNIGVQNIRDISEELYSFAHDIAETYPKDHQLAVAQLLHTLAEYVGGLQNFKPSEKDISWFLYSLRHKLTELIQDVKRDQLT